MKYLKEFLIAVLIVGLLASCGVNYNLRRMAYHKRMAIAKGAYLQADTIYTDRVEIIPGDSTVVTLPGSHTVTIKDTVIYQDRIKIRVRRDTIRETIQVECPPDSIIVRVPVAVNTEIDCPPPNRMWRTVAFVLMGLLALLVYIVARR